MPFTKGTKPKKQVTATALITLLTATFAGEALKKEDTFHPCSGRERWDVKTLTDQEASKIDYNQVIPTTIEALSKIPITFNPNKEAEFYRHPEECHVYQIKNCKIKLVKDESDADGDFHLVLIQGKNTMIGEVPDYHCENNKLSPAISIFKKVRKDFQPLLIGSRYLNYTYDITGVGFFDPPHGQTGRNEKNGIELHPILDIKIH